MMYALREYDGLNNTPAVGLIARGWSEMRDSGTVHDDLPASWDQQAIVALAVEIPIGVITYSHEKWRRIVWIHFGYIIPEMRRRGIYRLLWERVVKAAQRLQAVEIQGGIHVNNGAMLRCAANLGRTQLFVTTRFVVPPAKVQKR